MLVVTDQHTMWGWGSNAAGQLGAGCMGAGRSSRAGQEAALPPSEAATSSMLSWVAAPLEVVDSVAAAAMGLPTAASCGEDHSALLCRNGQVWGAGSNASGACGLPVVQLAAAAWSEVPLPPGAALAVAVSCGRRNTAVVTHCGRLLVCGANESGQAAVGRQGGCCYLLADVGPSAAWHGMQRTNQLVGGGGGDAANRAVGVACGSGSLYALTSSGEVFSWGQGGQGVWLVGLCLVLKHLTCGRLCWVKHPPLPCLPANPSSDLHPPLCLQASWAWEAAARMCAPRPACPGRTMWQLWRPPVAGALPLWWIAAAACSPLGQVGSGISCWLHAWEHAVSQLTSWQHGHQATTC